MFTQWRNINQENGSDETCLLIGEVTIKKKVVTQRVYSVTKYQSKKKSSVVTCLLGDEVSIKKKVVT